MSYARKLEQCMQLAAVVAVVVAAGVTGLTAVPAHARPCASAADCPARFSCVSVGQTACSAPPCSGPDCSATPVCVTRDVKVCRSQQCRSDSDCPSDMFCYYTTAGTGCLPRYLPQCATANDCGDGFECRERVALTCDAGAAGGGGSSAAGSGAGCTSRPTGEFYCELKTLSCSSADDCPNRFSCGSSPSTEASDAGADAGLDDDAGVSRGDAGAAQQVCLPPYAGMDFDLALNAPARGSQSQTGSSNYVPYDRGYRHHRNGCSVLEPAGTGAASFGYGLAPCAGLALLWFARRRGRGSNSRAG